MEDALKRLDKLTHEEARMMIAENLRATHAVDERVAGVDDRLAQGLANVDDRVADVIHGVQQVERSSSPYIIDIGYRVLFIISENQLRDSIHRWLSPPDPSTNHNIACGTHHKKPATWFFQGSIYKEWKSKGSLLWVHGKRTPCPIFLSDTP
jgi:hypothetical protein